MPLHRLFEIGREVRGTHSGTRVFDDGLPGPARIDRHRLFAIGYTKKPHSPLAIQTGGMSGDGH